MSEVSVQGVGNEPLRVVMVCPGSGEHRQRMFRLSPGQVTQACLGKVSVGGQLLNDVCFRQQVGL